MFANKTLPAFKWTIILVAGYRTNCHYRSVEDDLKIRAYKGSPLVTEAVRSYVLGISGKDMKVARSYHNFCTAYFNREKTISWRPKMKYTSKREEHDYELFPWSSLWDSKAFWQRKKRTWLEPASQSNITMFRWTQKHYLHLKTPWIIYFNNIQWNCVYLTKPTCLIVGFYVKGM